MTRTAVTMPTKKLKVMKKITVLFLTSLTISSFSQSPLYDLPLYPRAIPNEGTPVTHRYLGESRIKYAKRVHRVIDSRMKQNKDITWPQSSLNEILWKAVTQGYAELPQPKAYANDSLLTIITETQIRQKVTTSSWVEVPNPDNPDDPYDLVTTQVTTAFDITSITKFRIIEDWIFDAQYGDMRPRIVAIAPLYNRISESGIDLGEAELFWLKMDDIRPVLAQRELFNRFNDAARISYDQWFEQRRFDSHIVKQSNVYDADIVYMEGFRDDGIEALLEAGKIKNDLFVMEHDFWEY